MINYIEMLLLDKEKRSYSYYIEVSVDGNQYERLIDYTATYCRSWQFLHFPPRPVQFIKLVGTRTLNIPEFFHKYVKGKDGKKRSVPDGGIFEVVGLKAIYIDNQQTANHKEPGFLRPTNNVANPEIGAIVVEGGGFGLLNEKMDDFSCHQKNGQIVLQLNQPYYIGSLRMLLGCDRNHSNQYSFYIETSLENENWQMAVDKRDESLLGWQQFEFEERLVVFVKIVGTQSNMVGAFVVNFKLLFLSSSSHSFLFLLEFCLHLF